MGFELHFGDLGFILEERKRREEVGRFGRVVLRGSVTGAGGLFPIPGLGIFLLRNFGGTLTLCYGDLITF